MKAMSAGNGGFFIPTSTSTQASEFGRNPDILIVGVVLKLLNDGDTGYRGRGC